MHITTIGFSLLIITSRISGAHLLHRSSESEAGDPNNSGSDQSGNPYQGWLGLYRIPDCADHLIRNAKNWPEKALNTTYDPRPTIVDEDCHPWAPAIDIDDGPPSVGVQFGAAGTEFKALKIYKLTGGCTSSGYDLSKCCEDDGYLGILNRSGIKSDFNAKTNVGQLRRGQCVNANSTFWKMQFYQAVY